MNGGYWFFGFVAFSLFMALVVTPWAEDWHERRQHQLYVNRQRPPYNVENEDDAWGGGNDTYW